MAKIERETFATALTCMDGRGQEPGTIFMRRETGAKYVDAITEPGMVKYLVEASEGDGEKLADVRYKLGISLRAHNSLGVGVFAHEECAGNPTDNDRQISQLVTACSLIGDLVAEGQFSLPVFGIFISRQASGLWVADEKVSARKK